MNPYVRVAVGCYDGCEGDDEEFVRVDTWMQCVVCGVPNLYHPLCPKMLSGIDGLPYINVICGGRHVKL